jgi:VanZ family protein
MISPSKKIIWDWWPALLVMAIIFTASSIPGDSLPNVGAFDFSLKKGAHACGYALLAMAYLRGLTRGGKPTSGTFALAIVMAVFYAASDEFHQLFTPGRSASPVDVMIDAAGAGIGILFWTSHWRRFNQARRE